MPSLQPKNCLFRILALLLVTSMVFVIFPASRASGNNSLFSEDFENGFSRWIMGGLWNPEMQSEDCGSRQAPFPSPTHAAYYGINGQCNYNNGSANSGYLTLAEPVVMPPSVIGRTANLTFSSYEEAEGSSAYDIRRVQVSKDGGATWETLGLGTIQGSWTLRSYDLTSYLGTSLLLRFQFDSVDASLNSYFGWLVDNITIFTIDPPDAADDSFSGNEDAVLVISAPGLLVNDSDPDGDPLAVAGYQSISDLRVPVSINPDGSFRYDPTGVAGLQALDFGEFRQDTFTYITSDGNGGTDQATVFVNVNGVDDAPVANADTIGTDEDVPVSIWVLSNDTDLEHDQLAIVSSSHGSHGSVQISPDGSFLTYLPALNYFGTDAFSYTVSDGLLTSSGEVTVMINSLNDPPVLAPIGDKTVSEESQLTFTAHASDPDLPVNTQTYSLDPAAPTGASINPTTGAFTWTPGEVQGPGVYSVTVRVTDNGSPNLSDSETITITVHEVNLAPVLDSIDNRTISEGELLSFTVTATDADLPVNGLEFTLDPGAPAGANIDLETGQFNWTPSEAQGPGSYPIIVRVRDDGSPNLSDTKTFTVTVNESNSAPVLDSIGNKIVDEGVTLIFTATASDVDLPAKDLSYSLINAPSGSGINPTTGVFTWTPVESQGPSTYTFTVRVRDNGNPVLEDTEVITVAVSEVNSAPVLNPIGDQSVNDNSTLSFTASANDPDLPANTITFSLDPGAPTGASINPTNGQFTWAPSEDISLGTYLITIRVKDDGSPVMDNRVTLMVTVTEGNVAPILGAIGNKTVDEGSALSFTATATDTDIPANSLTFSLDAGAPSGASIDPNTGQFTWIPNENQGPGPYTLTVRVSDNGSPTKNDSEEITITVKEINQAPILAAVGDRAVDEGVLLSFLASATDTDLPANSLSYSLDAGAPDGASINASTGAFTWAPTEDQGPGVYSVTIRVSDNETSALEDWESFNITVFEVNAAPVLGTIGDRSVSEGTTLTFTATATDSDSQPNSLAFSLDPGAPSGASIHPTSGQFTWMPTEAQGPGSYRVTVQVTDNGLPNASDSEMITIAVTEVNTAPVLAQVSDQVVDENVMLNFTASASDSDEPASSLLFLLDSGAPVGASIHPTSGVFSWIPTEEQGPGVYRVTLRVRDGGTPELDASQTISITVNEVNSTPVANDDEYFLLYNSGSTFLNVLANDSSAPDLGETLIVSDASPANHGTVTLVEGKINYTPETGYSGGDSFLYTVTDGHGAGDSAQVNLTIGQPPQPPAVEAGPNQSAAEGQPVSFTGSYTNFGPPHQGESLPQITWNFGDGSVLTGSLSPVHTYQENGLYNVTLSVLAENGGQSSDAMVVNVANVAPVVNAGVDQSVKAGSPVDFNGSFDDPSPVDRHEVTWDFGDGQNSSGGLSTSHTFSEPGTYTVTLEVLDDDGGIGVDTLEVNVRPHTYKIYLPVISRPGKIDLQGSFLLTPQKTTFAQGEEVLIQVTVTNAGESPASDFWVDLYINPSSAPTSAGPTWDKLCRLSPCYGIAWYVSEPLLPGSSLTLTSTTGSYAANHTRWPGSFIGGTTDLYLLVDSWFPLGRSGAIPETNETNNRSELHGLYVTGSSEPPEDGEPPVGLR